MMLELWAVACTNLHAVVGPFASEESAKRIAAEMNAAAGEKGCSYRETAFYLYAPIGLGVDVPDVPPDVDGQGEPTKAPGQYL